MKGLNRAQRAYDNATPDEDRFDSWFDEADLIEIMGDGLYDILRDAYLGRDVRDQVRKEVDKAYEEACDDD